MQVSQLNFSSLRLLYAIFLVRVWVHRGRMILTRVLVVGGLAWLFYLAARPEGVSTHFSGTFGLAPFIWLSIALWLGLMIGTGWCWEQFARDNGLELVGSMENPQPSHSFEKRLLGSKRRAILIPLGGRKLYLEFFLYKEGGWLRWREYRLDLSVRIDPEPPVHLPHVVADATARDELRVSNMRRNLRDYVEFRAEGAAGDAYRLLAPKVHTVDALAILTPDVLQELLGVLPGADVEFKDGSVWFVNRNFRFTDEGLAGFLDGSLRAMSEIDRQLRPYRQAP